MSDVSLNFVSSKSFYLFLFNQEQTLERSMCSRIHGYVYCYCKWTTGTANAVFAFSVIDYQAEASSHLQQPISP